MTRSARLTHVGRVLWISQDDKVQAYVIDREKPDTRVADPAFSLLKADGTKYHVHHDRWGWQCNCAAFTFSKAMKKTCKHVDAMKAVGLIPKPAKEGENEGDVP